MKKLLIFVLIISVFSGMSFAKGGKGKEESGEKSDKDMKRESKQQQKKEPPVEEAKEQERERETKQGSVNKEEAQMSSGAGDEQKSKKGKDQSIETQISHEKSKHETRLAKLAKMKELAEGDEKTLTRVNKLMEKENKRFTAKMAKLAERGTGVSDEELAEAAKKGDPKIKGKNKDKGKADKGEQPEPGEE